MFKGITKRWLINTFGVVSAIVVLLIIFISVAVHSLCYSTVENELLNQTKKLNTVFPNGVCENADTFEEKASAYAGDFSDKDEMEVQILNASGRVITTSAGFGAETENLPDYVQAQSSDSGIGRYRGRSDSGEKIMAVTVIIKSSGGTELGAVRYVTSLRKADSKVLLYTILAIIVGLLIISVVAVSGLTTRSVNSATVSMIWRRSSTRTKSSRTTLSRAYPTNCVHR